MAKAKKQSKADYEQEVGELTADIQRIQADFINFKRRVEEDQQRISSASKASVIAQLLTPLDNLHRAMGHTPAEMEGSEYIRGISSVAKQLHDAMLKLGVEKIDAKDKEFNPELMEAVSLEPGEGEKEIVSEVLQEGFTLNGEVIRHAMVKVRKEQ